MRTRSRGAASPSTGSTTSGASRAPQKSFLRRGADAFAEAERNQEEIERKKSQGGNVLRFYVKAGEECEVIILDDSLDNAVAFYEHNLQDAQGKWGVYEPCVKDFGECPLCAGGNNSYYVMMLSVLVLKEFQTKAGATVKWSKMLLPVKIGQFDQFRRLEAAAKKECGTMRGMYLVMARSKSDKSPRIGEPAILDNGKMFDMIPEDELEETYGHDEVKGQDKKTVVRPANFDITPYDYIKLFPAPDVSSINKRYGDGKPATGSVDEALAEFNDDQPAETTTRTRRRAASEPQEEAAPTRSRRGAASAAKEGNPFED